MEQYFFTASASDISLTFDTKYGPCHRVCSDRLEYTNISPVGDVVCVHSRIRLQSECQILTLLTLLR